MRGAPVMPMVPHGAAKGGVPAMSEHLCAGGAPHHTWAPAAGDQRAEQGGTAADHHADGHAVGECVLGGRTGRRRRR
ncbi:hypothetical protein ACFZCU_37175 [Streptomyces canus]|uniref:hypothetical protein n=1 Tax=Streptomyces canus TaxID=58343 RepID=UPI0036ED14B7